MPRLLPPAFAEEELNTLCARLLESSELDGAVRAAGFGTLKRILESNEQARLQTVGRALCQKLEHRYHGQWEARHAALRALASIKPAALREHIGQVKPVLSSLLAAHSVRTPLQLVERAEATRLAGRLEGKDLLELAPMVLEQFGRATRELAEEGARAARLTEVAEEAKRAWAAAEADEKERKEEEESLATDAAAAALEAATKEVIKAKAAAQFAANSAEKAAHKISLVGADLVAVRTAVIDAVILMAKLDGAVEALKAEHEEGLKALLDSAVLDEEREGYAAEVAKIRKLNEQLLIKLQKGNKVKFGGASGGGAPSASKAAERQSAVSRDSTIRSELGRDASAAKDLGEGSTRSSADDNSRMSKRRASLYHKDGVK